MRDDILQEEVEDRYDTSERNRVRSMIKKHFGAVDVVTLIPPSDSQSTLISHDCLPFSDVDVDFVQQTNQLWSMMIKYLCASYKVISKP